MHFIKKQMIFILLLIATRISSNNIMQDLEINKIFATINKTYSQQGEKYLLNLLSHPISDYSILEKRQNTIAFFTQNPSLQKKVCTLLNAFKKHESIFVALDETSSSIETAAIEPFYYTSDYCKEWNYNPLLLDLGHVAHVGNMLSSVAQHALAYAFFTWGLEEEHTCATCTGTKHDQKNDKLNKKKNKQKDTQKNDNHKQKDCHGCKHGHHHKPKTQEQLSQPQTDNALIALIKSPGFRKAFEIWHGISAVQELYAIQKVIRTELHLIKQIQAQLMGIRFEIQAMHALYAQISKYPLLVESLEHFSHLKNLCEKKELSQKLTSLLALLEESTFKGKPSSFSRIGIILAAYKLATEVINELTPALTAIGEIDAYNNCATLLNEHKNSHTPYSFAQYITNAQAPEIVADQYWHPLLNNNTAVLNSIHLNNKEKTRNIILTGPNASGKSTNLKTLTLCTYLAQTITIVPATNYRLTPFTEIYSSIVLTDNIEENMSLFATELQKAEKLLARVKSCNKNEFIFIALDELFTSTHYKNGQKIAQQLLNHLYSSEQVMSIVATHFEELTKCAKEEHYQCSNYTVQDFILKPGISSAQNSFDVINKHHNKHILLQ